MKKFLVFLFVFINLGNHLTESTFKQFFYDRGKFKPDFDAAFEIIKKSETNKIILYREAKIDKKPDHSGIVLSNYVHTIIKNKKYEINLVNRDLENYRGKVWNLCLTLPVNECFKPSANIKVLRERILQGGIKLSLWENK